MEILQKPIVTEKMNSKGESLNQYGFIVNVDADKPQIKSAIEQMYNVTVLAVNTINSRGKLKTRYTKSGILSGRTNASKKAIVTIKDGEVIDFYSNI
jgi:large subunit ribosomal protein L23